MRKNLLSLMMCASMSATALIGTAGTAFAGETEEPVSLRAVMYGDPGTRNTEFFENEFHDKVLEELNIDMTVEYVPWGGKSQIMTMAASGEGFAFMGGVTSSTDITGAGLYTTFTQEMFDELAPHYEEARMSLGFDCAKYKGDIIAIPCGAVPFSAMNTNFSVRNDILNEVGWDVSQIEDYDDLMEAIAAVHEAYPDMHIVSKVNNLYMSLLGAIAPDGALFNVEPPTAICFVDESDPESDTVISNLESEYFKNFCAITKEWMDLGYLSVEDLTDPSIGETAWISGNCLLTHGGSAQNIYDHDMDNVEGSDVQYLKIDEMPNIMKQDSNWQWLVTKADQDKAEDWVRFFDWMYASKENYMFCLYGVEGTDWQYKEDGTIEKLTQDQFFYDWMHRTLLYEAPSKEVYDPEEVEAYIHFDDGAVYSKAIGFVFDKTPVEAVAAKLQTIIDEKVKPIAYGVGDYEKDFPAVLEELKEAGLDEYVAEYQRQFSEFMAAKSE